MANTSRFPVDTEFGTRINEARIEKNLSLGKVADEVGISVSELMALEQGNRQIDSAHVLVKLAEVLELPKEELIVLATKRTYQELLEEFQRHKKELKEEFGDEPDDEDFLFNVSMLAHMSEEMLWEAIAQELLSHENTGEWTVDKILPWDDDDDDDDSSDENFEI